MTESGEEAYIMLMLSDSNLPTGMLRVSDSRRLYCLHGARVVLLARVHDAGAAEFGVNNDGVCGAYLIQLCQQRPSIHAGRL